MSSGPGPSRRGRRRWSGLERDLRQSGGPLIAGVDEVGRGSLAGPVVACAVIMPPDARAIAGVDDSKRLTAAQRLRLATRIRSRALALSLGAASSREVDRVNVYHATVLAMRRALRRLSLAPDHVLIDGRPIRTLGVAHLAVVGGDARCFSIACASIVAKVTRDSLMRALASRHPHYGWDRNAGYGTPEHWRAIERAGRCAHHRSSFLGARQLALELEAQELADDSLPAEVILDAIAPVAPVEGEG
ncbi:MAG TPA: ribonuclease HII [Gemmatimonadaceae bacterium]|nr:ribonuclease HII [Gemmatimonadaceae bacterium]